MPLPGKQTVSRAILPSGSSAGATDPLYCSAAFPSERPALVPADLSGGVGRGVWVRPGAGRVRPRQSGQRTGERRLVRTGMRVSCRCGGARLRSNGTNGWSRKGSWRYRPSDRPLDAHDEPGRPGPCTGDRFRACAGGNRDPTGRGSRVRRQSRCAPAVPVSPGAARAGAGAGGGAAWLHPDGGGL